MKYYKIQIKTNYGNRIASSANGKNVPDGEKYFSKIRKGDILVNTPVFDYFILESYDKEEYWNWSLFDVFDGMGDYPGNNNWFISDAFKELLKNFKIAPKYHFYESELFYKNNKLKYWIFQFIASYRKLNKMEFIDFSQCHFSMESEVYIFNSYEDWSNGNELMYEKHNLDLKLEKVYINHFFDYIPLNPISSDILCSENLKNAIETIGITGLEFSELDYEVVVEK